MAPLGNETFVSFFFAACRPQLRFENRYVNSAACRIPSPPVKKNSAACRPQQRNTRQAAAMQMIDPKLCTHQPPDLVIGHCIARTWPCKTPCWEPVIGSPNGQGSRMQLPGFVSAHTHCSAHIACERLTAQKTANMKHTAVTITRGRSCNDTRCSF